MDYIQYRIVHEMVGNHGFYSLIRNSKLVGKSLNVQETTNILEENLKKETKPIDFVNGDAYNNKTIPSEIAETLQERIERHNRDYR